MAFRRTGEALGRAVDDAWAGRLGGSVPDWPAFPDSAGALASLATHYQLIVVSNVHRDGFAASNRRLRGRFAAIITAEDVHAYKPADNHFRALLHTLDGLGIARGELLHVAQSLFHDHVPARRAGLRSVWINRCHGRPGWGATPSRPGNGATTSSSARWATSPRPPRPPSPAPGEEPGRPPPWSGPVTVPYRWTAILGRTSPDVAEDRRCRYRTRTRTLLAWSLWLATLGCCAAGLAVTLAVVRPLTVAVLAEGAARALAYPLGYATVGLVLTLRRPANPIGWLYAAAGLMWSLAIPGEPWVAQLVAEGRPLPLAAQAAAVYGEFNWAPATVLGVTLPALLVPDGRLRSRRWRPVAAAAVAGGALALVGSSLAPARLEDLPIVNPFGLAGPAGDVASAAGHRRHPPLAGHPGRGAALRGAAVPGRPWGGAPAVALGRGRRRRRGGRADGRGRRAAGHPARVGPVRVGAVRAGGGGGGGAALPAVGPGPPRQPHRHLRARHRPAGAAATWSSWPPAAWPRLRQPGRGRRHPGGGRRCSSRCAAGSRTWSTGASTAAAMTPPAPWTPSRPGSATRSTWTPCRASCWRWSTRPCSRPGRRCGSAPRRPRGRTGSPRPAGQRRIVGRWAGSVVGRRGVQPWPRSSRAGNGASSARASGPRRPPSPR